MYKKYIPNKVRKFNSEKFELGVMATTNVRVPTSFEAVTIDRIPSVYGNTDVVKYRSDIYLLLNQKRLDRMSLQAFSDYLNSMPQSSNDGLSQLRSKVGDADLLKYVKSRYIQSRSELIAWSQYLTANYAQAQQEVKDYLAQQQADNDTNSKEPTSPAKTD